jgi:hypothetical protein
MWYGVASRFLQRRLNGGGKPYIKNLLSAKPPAKGS